MCAKQPSPTPTQNLFTGIFSSSCWYAAHVENTAAAPVTTTRLPTALPSAQCPDTVQQGGTATARLPTCPPAPITEPVATSLYIRQREQQRTSRRKWRATQTDRHTRTDTHTNACTRTHTHKHTDMYTQTHISYSHES